MTLVAFSRLRPLLAAVPVGVAIGILAVPAAVQAVCPDDWVVSWVASPTAAGTWPGIACPSQAGLQDQTVRNIVLSSVRGDRVRVRLTNAFGSQPLRIGGAAVAVAGSGAETVPGSRRTLSFHGDPSTTIQPGAETLSDAVPMPVQAFQHLAVSVYVPDPTGPATQHLFTQQTNYLSAGDATRSSSATPYATAISCWLFVDGIDVAGNPAAAGAVVALGDSITDGALSTAEAGRGWPEGLARRFNARPGRTLSVVNAGISGNQLLLDRQPPLFGPSALHRLDRDVLDQSGARDVILLEGINDIGGDHVDANRLIAGDKEIVSRARARGLRVFGGTLVPFGGSHEQFGGDYGTPWGEQQRQALNDWIRTGGGFDGVIDFDHALADPAAPDRMDPRYDSGDHLHPSDAGYAAMAQAVELDPLLPGT